MLKSFKYRIYPTRQQSVLIDKHIHNCRFIYNLALETKLTAYAGNKINLSCFDLTKQLPVLKKECPWLKEIDSQSLQQSVITVDVAFNRFFKGQGNFPKFKKKTAKQSYKITQNIFIDFDSNKLIIPKFKKSAIKIIIDRKFTGQIKQATVSKTPTHKYFISILVETNKNIPNKKLITPETTVGIDLGIKDFITISNGLKIDNPKFLKNDISKLKYIQSRYSKFKGKKNKLKFAKLHEKITNKRKNFLHQTSIQLINNHDSIAIENLDIKGMLQNQNLSQSIQDCSWSKFITMLKYKAEWYGKNILQIGRFEPSSKTCSICGAINKSLILNDREWECSNCGSVLDRDINAAQNIKNFALKKYSSVERRLKNQNELPTLVGVLTSGAHLGSSWR